MQRRRTKREICANIPYIFRIQRVESVHLIETQMPSKGNLEGSGTKSRARQTLCCCGSLRDKRNRAPPRQTPCCCSCYFLRRNRAPPRQALCCGLCCPAASVPLGLRCTGGASFPLSIRRLCRPWRCFVSAEYARSALMALESEMRVYRTLGNLRL